MSGFFVTGTDTDVGKTWATVALMQAFKRQGFTVAGMKPVAAGCVKTSAGWQNQDALWLQQHASRSFPYASVNPYAFEMPVSPHIACGDQAVRVEDIVAAYQRLQADSDLVLVEGAGGWYSPLGLDLDNASLAKVLQLPVMLVVGMRLGCINHALLTQQAIRQAGCRLAGWLAVTLESSMIGFQANLDYLGAHLEAPLLGVLPYQSEPDFEKLADAIRLKSHNGLM